MIELLIEDERGNAITHQLGEGRHTLGKSTDSDIILMDDYASRYHADIFITKAGIYIIDMNSTNGIWFEQKRINKFLKIEYGQSFNLGKLKLTVKKPRYNLYVREGRKPVYEDPADYLAASTEENVDEKVLRLLMS